MMSPAEFNARLMIRDKKTLEDYAREVVGKQCFCGHIFEVSDDVCEFHHTVTCSKCRREIPLFWVIGEVERP